MTKHDHQSYEQDYFERRAEAELELAQTATHAGAVKAHYELAELYLDIVHGPGPQDAAAPADGDAVEKGPA
jgi:hypothetical protein